MSDAEDLLSVEIYGQSYKLRGEGQKDYIQKLAGYLDSKMNQIADSSTTVDSLKVAILAALNITDEYFQALESGDSRDIAKDRIDKLVKIIDECLED